MKSSSAWGWIKQKNEPGQKVQAFEFKLGKIDDAVIGLFLRFLSSKDDLINCVGRREDELFNLFEVLSHSHFLYLKFDWPAARFSAAFFGVLGLFCVPHC